MLPETIYIIDHLLLSTWQIDVGLRKPKLLAYVQVLIGPIIRLYMDFSRFRKQKLYELSITPQVCYLQKLLNDRYDNSQRRIIIVDSVFRPSFFLYRDDELKPVYFFTDIENTPTYIYTDGESQAYFDDFIIKVPASITFEAAEMKSLVKLYCLAGKRFKIELV